MKLDNVRLLVNNFVESFHFWHEIVGLKVLFRDKGNMYAYFDAGAARIELLDAGYFAATIGQEKAEAAEQRGVVVFGSDDVDATYAELVERGAPSLKAPYDHEAGFARVALLQAPDGYVLEVFTTKGNFPGNK